MKKISPEYKKIFDDYYSKKARVRFSAIRSYAYEFIEQYPVPVGTVAGVNDVALESFITSYFLDVIKFKEYHFKPAEDQIESNREFIHKQKMLSPSKVASLTLKWLLKFHPAYFTHPNLGQINQRDRLNLSRAPFILCVNISLKLAEVRIEEMSPELYRRFVYHARFRDIDDRSLFLYFDALRDGMIKK